MNDLLTPGVEFLQDLFRKRGLTDECNTHYFADLPADKVSISPG